MRIDSIIQALLPHDEKFYQFFEESAQNLKKATELLQVILSSRYEERVAHVEQMHELEHLGDTVTHKIFAELNATFVTPFDREDIHVLASALDDIMDFIDGSASRFVLYKIHETPPDMIRLANILDSSVRELIPGIRLLRDLRNPEKLQNILKKVNEYENDADEVFQNAIAKLFEEEKDAIKTIKLKEIYVGLETATDKCEDAANVLETLLIKHA
jgi:predicted phosphate transport protein (TIGR00153 family)